MTDPLFLKDDRLSLVMESLVTSWDAFKCILAEEVYKKDDETVNNIFEALMRHIDSVDDGIMGMMESFELYVSKGI